MNYSFPLDKMPQRHNSFFKSVASLGMRVSGWTMEGEVANVPKLLAVAAPHRSAWEAILGIMVLFILGLDVRWMVKHTVFWGPLGPLARWFGGIAIDRRSAHGVVKATIEQFRQREKLLIVLMPEGTRAKAGVPVAEWKRGFYHIGHTADVPLMPIYLDHANRRVVFGKAISLQSDIETTVATLQAFYDREKEAAPDA